MTPITAEESKFESLDSRHAGWLLLGAMVVALLLHLTALQKNIPYMPEVDETLRVERAVHMIVAGTLNPRFFTHPGSTTLYPMAGIYYLWGITAAGAHPLHPGPALSIRFAERPWEFFLLARMLSLLYSVLTIWLVFLVGRRVFGPRTAIAAAWLMVFYRLILYHGTVVRTDTAAAFFGMIALWMFLKVLDNPTRQNHLMAGLAIGAAVASRYFMLALVPVLCLVDLVLFCRLPRGQARTQIATFCFFGLLAAAATFVILNPYLFLDARTATRHVQREARSIHPGADGLSRVENFFWYLTDAIPHTISHPQMLLAGIALIMLLMRPRIDWWIPAGFAASFLVAISAHPLHWQRWIIPVVPVLALMTAWPLDRAMAWWGKRRCWTPARQGAMFALAVAILSFIPALLSVQMAIRFWRPSTQVQARAWIKESIPAGSRIAQEFYGPPIEDFDYDLFTQFALSDERTLQDYRAEGFEYIITCSQVYKRFFAQPARYPAEVAFYEALQNECDLLKEFTPALLRGGPIVRIYRLAEPAVPRLDSPSTIP